jgi:hypothetical protein
MVPPCPLKGVAIVVVVMRTPPTPWTQETKTTLFDGGYLPHTLVIAAPMVPPCLLKAVEIAVVVMRIPSIPWT